MCAAALVGGTAFITSTVISQQDQGGYEMSPEMQKWMELGTPGKEHAELAKCVGKWNMNTKMWEEPGSEPQTSQCTCEYKSIMGGRYIVEKMNGDFQGSPMEGMSIAGYDNFKKKYVYCWVDSMSTGLFIGEGTADASGKTITYISEMPDPMKGGMQQVKSVETKISDNERKFQMFMKDDSGKWWLHFEGHMTRAK